MKRPELLAPVGKMENAIAAIENGADALFVGGKLFNARQAADNFNKDELKEITSYAKLRGVKVYVTVNILIKEDEIKTLFDYLAYLEETGIDAIIIQDLGIANIVSRYFPNIRMHASTQISAHSVQDVMFLKELGFKRVVLARELQIKEIISIIEETGIEVETFIHGALCYSYSGQCLMSSLIGGRSGNRGRCAQPCRMKYSLHSKRGKISEDKYLISLKDICSVSFLPELINAGIHSFKVEGRMKSPEYVASVIKTYRKYVDLAMSGEKYNVLEEDMDIMKGIFNRGGFSSGYYKTIGEASMLTVESPKHIGLKAGNVVNFVPKTGMATLELERDLNAGDGIEIIRSGKESVGAGITKECKKGSQIKLHFNHYIAPGSEVFLTKNHTLLKEMKKTFQKPSRKIDVDINITGIVGQKVKLELIYKDINIEVYGPILEEAIQNPITEDKALKQFTKMGSTTFRVNSFNITWPDLAYIGIKDMNEMRREAITKLEQVILKDIKNFNLSNPSSNSEVQGVNERTNYKVYTAPDFSKQYSSEWICEVSDLQKLEVCIREEKVKSIYWNWEYNDQVTERALELAKQYSKKFYLVLPYIMKQNSYKSYGQKIKNWCSTSIDGYVVRNIGEYELVNNLGKQIVLDYNLNIMNNEQISLWMNRGVFRATISQELMQSEIETLGGTLERIVYGYLPVMTSSQCILRGTKECQKGNKNKETFNIEDRKSTKWQIKTDCEACNMQVISYEPMVLKGLEVQRLGENISKRLKFTNETVEETKDILTSYLSGNKMPVGKGISFKNVL